MIKNQYRNFSDEQLMAEIQKTGSHAAFEVLYNRYQPRLFRYTSYIVKDSLAAEDVAHEALIRAFYKRDSYTEIARFSTWVYTIAGNLARTERRRMTRRSIFSIDNEKKRYQRDVGVIPDDSQNPSDLLERKLASEAVMWKIGKLSPKLRNAITLRDVEQLSYEEISHILKIPEGTTKSRIHRARKSIHRDLRYLNE
ncbi:MAG: sigma-70 family RNA polymerase sigma factor [Candidatus Aenigmarchaeota archaeon]|nr:sigma-70 family RNA polymerase sigma factor [Candidatus Aenigmarchaeota archaeon]